MLHDLSAERCNQLLGIVQLTVVNEIVDTRQSIRIKIIVFRENN